MTITKHAHTCVNTAPLGHSTRCKTRAHTMTLKATCLHEGRAWQRSPPGELQTLGLHSMRQLYGHLHCLVRLSRQTNHEAHAARDAACAQKRRAPLVCVRVCVCARAHVCSLNVTFTLKMQLTCVRRYAHALSLEYVRYAHACMNHAQGGAATVDPVTQD